MNAVVFVAAVVAVVIALTVLSRASGRKKRMAREDLKREQEQVGHFDILDLVREELAETGAANVAGGDGVDPTVLLRVWKRDTAVREACAFGSLRFVIDDGVAAGDADVDTVSLACMDGATAVDPDHEETAPRETQDTEAPEDVAGEGSGGGDDAELAAAETTNAADTEDAAAEKAASGEAEAGSPTDS